MCSYCQKLRLNRKDLPVARKTLMTKSPMEEVSIDVIGPLPPDDKGNKFIIVMIDNFSHFIFAREVKDTTAETAARFIHEIGSLVGFPKFFRWDNCSQFENHLIRCLLELIGTKSHPSVPYNPETNGVVERAIQEIMRHLRFIVNERRVKTDWSLYLPMVLRILNNEPVATIGLKPVEILFPGRDDMGDEMYPSCREWLVKPSLDEIPDPARRKVVTQWVHHLRELQKDAIKNANKFIELVEKRKKDDRPIEYRQFKVGDYVICPWRGGRPDKLSTLKQGPFEVIQKLSGKLYQLRDPADDRLLERYAPELTKYEMGPGEDVRDTIAMDEFENLVQEIVDHRRTPGGTGVRALDFKIRWLGLGPDGDTWHPYSEMTRKGGLKAFWDYIENHPEIGIKSKRAPNSQSAAQT